MSCSDVEFLDKLDSAQHGLAFCSERSVVDHGILRKFWAEVIQRKELYRHEQQGGDEGKGISLSEGVKGTKGLGI